MRRLSSLTAFIFLLCLFGLAQDGFAQCHPISQAAATQLAASAATAELGGKYRMRVDEELQRDLTKFEIAAANFVGLRIEPVFFFHVDATRLEPDPDSPGKSIAPSRLLAVDACDGSVLFLRGFKTDSMGDLVSIVPVEKFQCNELSDFVRFVIGVRYGSETRYGIVTDAKSLRYVALLAFREKYGANGMRLGLEWVQSVGSKLNPKPPYAEEGGGQCRVYLSRYVDEKLQNITVTRDRTGHLDLTPVLQP
jgi:hypothetical protein